jgi:dTDP-4-dehydrorhamnose reductase
MDDRPILVTGGSGQVGGALIRLGLENGIAIVAPGRSVLDLTQEQSMVDVVAGTKWSAIINCAAYTAVDKAETDRVLAETINATAPAVLAREAARFGVPIVQVSTDYVFDGTKSSPYSEDDPVNPLGVYGQTKEKGERAVRSLNPRHAVVRTAWVVSAQGANFINTMLRLAAERPEVSVVDDQIGCPSSATDIAEALLVVAQQIGSASGTWHFVNNGEATWHTLAAHVFSRAKAAGLAVPMLHAISTAKYPTPAKRPANSRLATNAIQNDFDIKPRPWPKAIDAILAQRLKM